jgi:hypothetical protein
MLPSPYSHSFPSPVNPLLLEEPREADRCRSPGGRRTDHRAFSTMCQGRASHNSSVVQRPRPPRLARAQPPRGWPTQPPCSELLAIILWLWPASSDPKRATLRITRGRRARTSVCDDPVRCRFLQALAGSRIGSGIVTGPDPTEATLPDDAERSGAVPGLRRCLQH